MQDVPAELGASVPRGERASFETLWAVAAGEIEVALELALLAHDLDLPEHEAVGVEEPAQVDSSAEHGSVVEGSRARSEAVELDRREWVARGELVDDASILPPGRRTRFISARHELRAARRWWNARALQTRSKEEGGSEGKRARVRLEVLDAGRRASGGPARAARARGRSPTTAATRGASAIANTRPRPVPTSSARSEPSRLSRRPSCSAVAAARSSCCSASSSAVREKRLETGSCSAFSFLASADRSYPRSPIRGGVRRQSPNA